MEENREIYLLLKLVRFAAETLSLYIYINQCRFIGR